MTPNPIGLLDGQGGALLFEIIQNQGGVKAFSKNENLSLLQELERLADNGFLEALQETPEKITYKIIEDLPRH